jgi:L-2,4-diaminobutyric acid acetyltransferase
MDHSEAKKVHDLLELTGFRSLVTATGFFQLSRELKTAGVLGEDAIERIMNSMLSELLENVSRSLVGDHAHEEQLRHHLTELFAGTQPLSKQLLPGETARVGSHCAPSSPQAMPHTIRSPCADDARSVFALIRACPPLDPNSLYCNLLQCTHFSGTCLLAEHDGKIEGWVSGYRPPDDQDALFIWQVAVDEAARGVGLGTALLDAALRLPATADATRLITSVTPSNAASRQMFARLALLHGAKLTTRPWLDGARHFGGGHESEDLITIGPLKPRQIEIT